MICHASFLSSFKNTLFFFIIFAILKNYFGSLVMHKPDDDENLYFNWKIIIS